MISVKTLVKYQLEISSFKLMKSVVKSALTKVIHKYKEFELLLRPSIQLGKDWLSCLNGFLFTSQFLTHSLTTSILFYNYEWCEWLLSWSCHYLHPSQQEFQTDDVEQNSKERAQASVLGEKVFQNVI